MISAALKPCAAPLSRDPLRHPGGIPSTERQPLNAPTCTRGARCPDIGSRKPGRTLLPERNVRFQRMVAVNPGHNRRHPSLDGNRGNPMAGRLRVPPSYRTRQLLLRRVHDLRGLRGSPGRSEFLPVRHRDRHQSPPLFSWFPRTPASSVPLRTSGDNS